MSMNSWMYFDEVLKSYPLKELLHLCKEGRFDVLYQPMGDNPFETIRPLAGLTSKRLVHADSIPVNSSTTVHNKAFLPMHPHVVYAEVMLPKTFYEQFGRDFKLFHYERPPGSNSPDVWLLDLHKLFGLFHPKELYDFKSEMTGRFKNSLPQTEKGNIWLHDLRQLFYFIYPDQDICGPTPEMIGHFRDSFTQTERGGEGLSLKFFEIKSFSIPPNYGNESEMFAERLKYTNELIISFPNKDDKNEIQVQATRYNPNINDLEYVANCNQKQLSTVPSSFAFSQRAEEMGLGEILELSPTEKTEQENVNIELFSYVAVDELIKVLNNCDIQKNLNSKNILDFLSLLSSSSIVPFLDSNISWADETQTFIFDPDGFAKRFFYFNIKKGEKVFYEILKCCRFKEKEFVVETTISKNSDEIDVFDKIMQISNFKQYPELTKIKFGWTRTKERPGQKIDSKIFKTLQEIRNTVRQYTYSHKDVLAVNLQLFMYSLGDELGVQLLSNAEQYFLLKTQEDEQDTSLGDFNKKYQGDIRRSKTNQYQNELDKQGIISAYEDNFPNETKLYHEWLESRNRGKIKKSK